MEYTQYYKLTDDLITHLDSVFVALHDPFIESRYTGFLAVCGVTVLELTMKHIFCQFAEDQHVALGKFCSKHFSRINGKITLGHIRNEYLPMFGEEYLAQFVHDLEALEDQCLRSTPPISIKASYGNLITWRNKFAHQGTLAENASYGEIKRSYESGKELMACLFHSMASVGGVMREQQRRQQGARARGPRQPRSRMRHQ